VFLVSHLDIVLWFTSHAMLVEEGRVTALKNVDIGVVKGRIAMHV